MSIVCSKSSSGYPEPETKQAHIIIEDPSASENITLYYTDVAVTIKKIEAVVSGLASTPSVTWSVRHDTVRGNPGTEVVTGGTTTTDTSSGHTMFGFVGKSEVESFNSAEVPANSWLWATTSAISGDVSSISITIYFEKRTN